MTFSPVQGSSYFTGYVLFVWTQKAIWHAVGIVQPLHFPPFFILALAIFPFNLSSPASVKKLAFWPFSTQMAANFGLQIT